VSVQFALHGAASASAASLFPSLRRDIIVDDDQRKSLASSAAMRLIARI
jgi:hypothetical protein